MTVPEIFLIGFSIIVITSALAVVFSRNIVISAFALVLSFFGLAGVYVLLGSPFLAAVQVLVYAGAIVVLFVFVVLIVDQDRTQDVLKGRVFMLGAGSVVFLIALLLFRCLNGLQSNADKTLASRGMMEMRSIALRLFGEYLWPFEVLSVFLLMAIVAAYVLAREERSI